jgi:hypothetical protein
MSEQKVSKEMLSARTLEALKQARTRIDALERARAEPIAIVGTRGAHRHRRHRLPVSGQRGRS